MHNAIFLQIAKNDVKKIIVIKALTSGTKLVYFSMVKRIKLKQGGVL